MQNALRANLLVSAALIAMLLSLCGCDVNAGKAQRAAIQAQHRLKVESAFVTGPRKPGLLWRHDFGDQVVDEVLPGSQGELYVSLYGSKDWSDPLNIMAPVSRSISKLDSQGQELAALQQISVRGGTDTWDSARVSLSTGAQGRVIAVLSKWRRRPGKQDPNNLCDFVGEDSTLLAYDRDLKPLWSENIAGTFASGAPLLLADESIALDLSVSDPSDANVNKPGSARLYSAEGKVLHERTIPSDPANPTTDPGSNGFVAVPRTLKGGKAVFYSGRDEHRLLKLDQDFKIIWSRILPDRIINRPVVMSDGSVLITTSSQEETYEPWLESQNTLNEGGITILHFSAGGKELWHRDIPAMLPDSLAVDEGGNLYYLTRSTDGKEAEYKQMKSDQANSSDPTARMNAYLKEIERSTTLILHKETAAGREVWSYSRKFKTTDEPAMASRPIVDASGTCYLWAQGNLLAVAPDGTELFILELKTFEKHEPVFPEELTTGALGRIYLTGEHGDLLCYGDKPGS